MGQATRDDVLAVSQWERYVYMRDNGHNQYLEKSRKCEDYFAGLQWREEDLQKLRATRRPALTINQIMATLSTVAGEQIEQRSEIQFRPKGETPSQLADVMNLVWMHIAEDNQLTWVRSDVALDGYITSRGFYDVRLDFVDSMRGEVRIKQLNPRNVVLDPDIDEYDPRSWDDVVTTKWMNAETIAELYDKEAAKDLMYRAGSAFAYGFDSIERDSDRIGGLREDGYYSQMSEADRRLLRRIRVIDRQYRKLTMQKFFVDPQTGDMRVIPDSWDRDRIARVRELFGLAVVSRLSKRIRWTVTAEDLVLHDDWSPYDDLTIVPYFPLFRHGRTLGLVEHLLDPQELLNKTVSQELHVINTTANSGWKIKTGALVNMSIEELEQRGAETGLVLELLDINGAEKITPNGIPQGLDRMSFKAEGYMKTISNVSDSLRGFDREDVAARAILAKQARGQVNLSKMFDNQARSDYFLARVVVGMVQRYYTEERLLKITKSPFTNEVEELRLNYLTPEGTIANDLTMGEYDIVATLAPDRATLEDSQFEQAMRLRELGVAIPDEVLIQHSRLHKKSEVLKSLAQAKMDPLLQRKSEAEVALVEAEAMEKQAVARQKQADAELKVAKAQATGVDVEFDAERYRIDQEIALQKYRIDKEIELEREKMQLEMEIKREAERRAMMQARVAAARNGGQPAPG